MLPEKGYSTIRVTPRRLVISIVNKDFEIRNFFKRPLGKQPSILSSELCLFVTYEPEG